MHQKNFVLKTAQKNNTFYTCSRRAFITKIALASVALSMPSLPLSCAEGPQFEGSGKVPYKVWEELLHYLKTSPDNLSGRMDILINEANPEAMFLFVRDRKSVV